MGHDYGGHKAIAKSIKAKGLQKLKFYCQMCEKQCRDANGFKCHMQSESHQRQMALFRQDSSKFISKFSEQFKKDFIDLLRTRYCNQRVMANKVYNEYIADRHHVHMTSTVWSTLGQFVRMLGREGIAQVEEEVNGSLVDVNSLDEDASTSGKSVWYIRYMKRDDEKVRVETERREEKADERLDAEQRYLLMLEKQSKKRAKLEAQNQTKRSSDENMEASSDGTATSSEPVNFSIVKREDRSHREQIDDNEPSVFDTLESNYEDETLNVSSSAADEEDTINRKRKRSNMEQLIEEEERRKRRATEMREMKLSQASRREEEETTPSAVDEPLQTISPPVEPWLHKNIVVKVIHRTLGDGKYYKQKGIVKKVDGTNATVEMIKLDDVLLLDQQFLETVIPNVDHEVRIVKGGNAGKRAIMKAVKENGATLQLKNGALLNDVPFDFFAKNYSKRAKK